MKRLGAVTAVLLLVVACDQAGGPQTAKLSPAESAASATPSGQLKQLLSSNAKVIGYLDSADKPSVIASFKNGWLEWRTDAGHSPIAQGQVEVFNGPDRTCIGFENKYSKFAAQGAEQYLVCEALEAIADSNSLPRAQDFHFPPKTLFIQYQPPGRTGFTQYYYAAARRAAQSR